MGASAACVMPGLLFHSHAMFFPPRMRMHGCLEWKPLASSAPNINHGIDNSPRRIFICRPTPFLWSMLEDLDRLLFLAEMGGGNWGGGGAVLATEFEYIRRVSNAIRVISDETERSSGGFF